jgi:four helix bundle protein
MAIYSYRDLEVYQEAFQLALELHRELEGFPKEERYTLVDQMKRSSKSICALIAEGFAQKSRKPEFKRYLRMAHGSVQETKVWIEFSQALQYLKEKQARENWEAYDRLGKRLHRMIQTWE